MDAGPKVLGGAPVHEGLQQQPQSARLPGAADQKIDLQNFVLGGLASRSLRDALEAEGSNTGGSQSARNGPSLESSGKQSLGRRMTGELGKKLPLRKGSLSETKKEKKQRKKEKKLKEEEEKKKQAESEKDKKGWLRRKSTSGKKHENSGAAGGPAANGGAPEGPRLFKCSLEDVMALQADKPHLKIPIILQVLTDAVVRLGGRQMEGIFRIPGDSLEIQSLKQQMNEQQNYEIKTDDPNVVAGVLKLWFRELKPPLMPPDVYDECLINSTKPDILQKIVDDKLPPVNREVVYYTLHWLREMGKEEYAAKTMMGLDNLAMVFSPAFLRCPKTAIMMFNASKEKEVVETMLKHTCFSEEEKAQRTQPATTSSQPPQRAPPPLPAMPSNIPPSLMSPPSSGGGSNFRARLLEKFGGPETPVDAPTAPDASATTDEPPSDNIEQEDSQPAQPAAVPLVEDEEAYAGQEEGEVYVEAGEGGEGEGEGGEEYVTEQPEEGGATGGEEVYQEPVEN